jgi:hypothetical protein
MHARACYVASLAERSHDSELPVVYGVPARKGDDKYDHRQYRRHNEIPQFFEIRHFGALHSGCGSVETIKAHILSFL